MDTKSNIVDRVFSFFENHLVVCATALIGGLAPGVLTIGIFDRNLFLEMDILKLVLLSGSICIPSFGAIYIAFISTFEKNKTVYDVGGRYLALAWAMNAVVFGVVLFAKIMDRSLSLKCFCIGLAFMVLICMIISRKLAKEEHKKEIKENQKVKR